MKIELKKFDYILLSIITIIAILVVGICLSKTKIAKTPVIAEDTVIFQVFFRGVTITSPHQPLLPMDETFITIRNVPHKKITILDVAQRPRLTTILDTKGKPTLVEDAANPFLFDCVVTVFDDAKITDDGIVLGGNKLKVGLPIILEGKNYRFGGTVSSIEILSKDEAKNLKKFVAEEKERISNPQPINPLELMNGNINLGK